jgi:DNA-binding transcriptional LysR family regulator
VYASRGYVERFGWPQGIDELPRHALVGFDDSMAKHRLSLWLAEIAPGAPLAGRCNSVLGLIDSVKAGDGIAALPTALGDAEADLLRVIDTVPALTRAWRLLTTPELRRTPRVSAFVDFVVDEIETLRPIITG